MNQVRTNHMIKALNDSFTVDLATTVKNYDEATASSEKMKNYGGNYFCLGSLKPVNNTLKKRLIQLSEKAAYYLTGLDPEVFQSYFIRKKVIDLINKNKYEIIISNYWENSLFFGRLNGIYKILDPHYAVDENIEVFNNKSLSPAKKFFEKRRLQKNKRLEKYVIDNSDLILPLSQKTLRIFNTIAPSKECLLVADGTDTEYFAEYHTSPQQNTILFYGAMSSKQNVNAFFRFYYHILPAIKKEIDDIKILVVGAKPAPEINQLHNGNDITVTGFVEDVRPWLAKAWLKIIPLELGSGFRGRVVELMSMGIPVIGTHNALDSIGFENGKEGFISDRNEDLINFSVKLLKDQKLRNEIGRNAKEFALKNYSLEATFIKLSKFLQERFK